MSEPTEDFVPPYHLFLDLDEVPMAASALRLMISDEAHKTDIRRLAREVLASLEGLPDENGVLTVTLEPQQMKILFAAVKGLLNDLQRDQADEIAVLRSILGKLPDEHTIRAITLE